MTAITRPDFLEIVETANLWSEQVDDNIAQIDQHPIRVWKPFEFRRLSGLLFDFLRQMIGDRTHMTRRAARSDDHDISKRGFFRQVDNGEVFGFIIFQ